ncbi:MAG: hypothetical protein FWD76_05220, partial [Firmicutes bacterium]|nr:hypothetical protein [Bacillota bacterium]
LAQKFCKEAAGLLASLAQKAIAALISTAVNITVGTLGNTLLSLFWSITSLGSMVATALDLMLDGKLNNIVWEF